MFWDLTLTSAGYTEACLLSTYEERLSEQGTKVQAFLDIQGDPIKKKWAGGMAQVVEHLYFLLRVKL
jgi:hypothetical protein